MIDNAATRWAEAQTSIGQLLTDKNARRDALHFAVAPVVAAQGLLVGEHIGLNADGQAISEAVNIKLLGIVDPFLLHQVKPGERFWMFLYPNTITALRHVWDHPAFAEEGTTVAQTVLPSDSEKWMRAWAMAHTFRRLLR